MVHGQHLCSSPLHSVTSDSMRTPDEEPQLLPGIVLGEVGIPALCHSHVLSHEQPKEQQVTEGDVILLMLTAKAAELAVTSTSVPFLRPFVPSSGEVLFWVLSALRVAAPRPQLSSIWDCPTQRTSVTRLHRRRLKRRGFQCSIPVLWSSPTTHANCSFLLSSKASGGGHSLCLLSGLCGRARRMRWKFCVQAGANTLWIFYATNGSCS